MIQLYDKTTGNLIGNINSEQLQFLIDQLEEEGMEDRDYAITPLVLDYFETLGADPHLVAMLRQALDGREEMVIQWTLPDEVDSSATTG